MAVIEPDSRRITAIALPQMIEARGTAVGAPDLFVAVLDLTSVLGIYI